MRLRETEREREQREEQKKEVSLPKIEPITPSASTKLASEMNATYIFCYLFKYFLFKWTWSCDFPPLFLQAPNPYWPMAIGFDLAEIFNILY